MKTEELAKKIIEFVGGKDNIVRVWNCMTRIRFNLVHDELVEVEKLKELPKVINVQSTPSQFQIIIGKDVDLIAEAINEQLGKSASVTQATNKKSKNIKTVLNDIIEVISSIFSPILPAIIGAGMMKVIISLVTIFNLLPETSGLLQIFLWIGDSAFYFLPFLLAVSSARKFNVNEFVALCLAGVLLAPSLISGASEGLTSLKILGVSLPFMNYSSSVIPIILSVWLMSYVDKLVSKFMPKMLKAIFQSMIVLAITAPIMLVFIAPLGFTIGEVLSRGLIKIFSLSGPLAGMLLAGFNPLIVMTGMHYAFMPAAIQSIATNGYDNFWLPFALISNLAQTGAILAVLFKYKNKADKSVALSVAVSSFFGISEPGMYGITLKLKKPLYAAMIGSAVGGFVAALLQVKTYSFTAPSIFALPTYVGNGGDKQALYAILLGGILGLGVSFVLTLIFKFDLQETAEDNWQETRESSQLPIHIYAPMNGEIKPIKEVSDPTFAQEVMGKGLAIFPKEGVVYAPFDGEVSVLFHTKHAIGLKSKDEVEVLIHVGLETVELDGQYFDALVENGTQFKLGDPLLTFDLEKIVAAGYDVITPIVITNYAAYTTISFTEKQSVEHSDELIVID